MPGIVVGVAESDHSRQVLEWALREAAHHQAPLEVMTIRPEQVRPATRVFWGSPTYSEDSTYEELALMAVHEFVEKVISQIEVSVPDIKVKVTTGDAAAELARASLDADLLVLGSSATGLSRILGGTLSDQVVHRAACPVVVIPEGEQFLPPTPVPPID